MSYNIIFPLWLQSAELTVEYIILSGIAQTDLKRLVDWRIIILLLYYIICLNFIHVLILHNIIKYLISILNKKKYIDIHIKYVYDFSVYFNVLLSTDRFRKLSV